MVSFSYLNSSRAIGLPDSKFVICFFNISFFKPATISAFCSALYDWILLIFELFFLWYKALKLSKTRRQISHLRRTAAPSYLTEFAQFPAVDLQSSLVSLHPMGLKV